MRFFLILLCSIGVCADIVVLKNEHWSSLVPLPFEVVIYAGQKAREESWDVDNFFLETFFLFHNLQKIIFYGFTYLTKV